MGKYTTTEYINDMDITVMDITVMTIAGLALIAMAAIGIVESRPCMGFCDQKAYATKKIIATNTNVALTQQSQLLPGGPAIANRAITKRDEALAQFEEYSKREVEEMTEKLILQAEIQFVATTMRVALVKRGLHPEILQAMACDLKCDADHRHVRQALSGENLSGLDEAAV